MTYFEAFSLLACPPPVSRFTAWAEIHRDLQTPAGSDATMRQWAMQRMRDIVAEDAKRNNVACTATIAQDGPQVSPACQSVQPQKSDPVADLEAMRADLKECVEWLEGSFRGQHREIAAGMRIKWGLE